MAEKTISFEDIKKEYKKRMRKEEFIRKINAAKEFAVENKELVAAIPVVVALLGKGIGAVNKKIDLKKQQDLKDLYVYDRGLGAYLKYKRKPKAEELLQIQKRKQNGEKLANILDDMRLLAK